MPGEVINRNLTDDMQNMSDPIYDRSILYRERPTGLPPPSSDESSEEEGDKDGMLEEVDLGGCFGKGPGNYLKPVAIKLGSSIFWNRELSKT